jgi:hypothetical protein
MKKKNLINCEMNDLIAHLPNGAAELNFQYLKPSTLIADDEFDLPIPPHCTKIELHKSPYSNLATPEKEAYTPKVDCLPEGITHLTLGPRFNFRVASLPKSITHLTFGEDFAQPLENIPPSLQELHFEYSFHQSLDNLPITLRTLKTVSHVDMHFLPPALTHLYLWIRENNLFCPLPSSLTYLSICEGPDILDGASLPRLTELVVGGWSYSPGLVNLTSLKKLRITGGFTGLLDSLPSGLTHLTIDAHHFDNPIDNLPDSITHLEFTENMVDYRHSLKRLPLSLTHLEIVSSECRFYPTANHHITHVLTNSSLAEGLPHTNQSTHGERGEGGGEVVKWLVEPHS